MTYEKIPEIVDFIKAKEMDKSEHTIISYKESINKFLNFTGFSSLKEIENCESKVIRDFQKHLQESGLQNSSINTAMRPLKVMMYWMLSEENQYAKRNPFLGIKALSCVKKIKPYMTEEEVLKLLSSNIDFENKAIFALYITTGLRRNELVTLKLEDFDGSRIKVLGKENRWDYIPVMPEVSDMLYMYIDWRNRKYGNTQDALFLSKYNKQYSDGAMWYKFKTSLAYAGFTEERIKELHIHSMRHTFCANVGEFTDIYTLQKAMRHASMSSTQIYAHMKDRKLDQAILSQKPIF
jgi:site-specific recombinase XerD